MKDVLEIMLGFIYSLSMGDYFFFIGTFLLIVLFVYILYLIKCSDVEENKENKDEFDLEAVTKEIEKNYKPKPITLNSYEEEQENNAIISYEELVKNKEKLGIGYDDEYIFDVPDITVRKFDLDNTTSIKIDEPKLEVKLMNYDKEEEFLKALKVLQSNLN